MGLRHLLDLCVSAQPKGEDPMPCTITNTESVPMGHECGVDWNRIKSDVVVEVRVKSSLVSTIARNVLDKWLTHWQLA